MIARMLSANGPAEALPIVTPAEALQPLTDFERGRLVGACWACNTSFRTLESLLSNAAHLERLARDDDYRRGWLSGACEVARSFNDDTIAIVSN